MDKKIGNLTITSFCTDNIEHIRFRSELAKDDPIYDFISESIALDLIDVEEQNDIELNASSYIVRDNNKLVGYIYFDIISEENGIVELRYAVHPEYRRLGYLGYSDPNRKGYGEQILEECSNYLFTRDDINTVELHIRDDNEASIGCAKKAKYKYFGIMDKYFYIYRKSKNDSNI